MTFSRMRSLLAALNTSFSLQNQIAFLSGSSGFRPYPCQQGQQTEVWKVSGEACKTKRRADALRSTPRTGGGTT